MICVWKSCVVRCLLFDKLNTHDLMRQRKSYISISPGWCILERIVQNLLTICFCTVLFFTKYGVVCSESWAFPGLLPTTCKQLCGLSLPSRSSTKYRTLWATAVLVIFWGIWLEQNWRMFNESKKDSGDTWIEKSWIALWVDRDKKFCYTFLSDLVRSWSWVSSYLRVLFFICFVSL